MKTILIIEDDTVLRAGLRENLEDRGYHVLEASDGESGIDLALAKNPDLIILDVMIPGRNGFEVCRLLRIDGVTTPVLMLTARSSEQDAVLGLDVGADDYVTKPFRRREFLARCDALTRRYGNGGGTEITKFGEFAIDRVERIVRRSGNEIPLSPREYSLLDYFTRNPGKALSRETIMREVWESEGQVTLRSVDRFVTQLRKIIEENPREPRHVQTIREFGYRFCP